MSEDNYANNYGLGALVGGGLLAGLLAASAKRKPATKLGRAEAASAELANLARDLEGMLADATCLLGDPEARATIEPFSAEVSAAVGEVLLLRRRALLARSRLHALAWPAVRRCGVRLAAAVAAREAEVEAILALPEDPVTEEKGEVRT